MDKSKTIEKSVKRPVKQTIISADSLLPKTQFLARYKIKPIDFNNTGFSWDELTKIFDNYSSLKPKLEHSAKAIVEILFSKEAREIGIHSVRYRVKDAHGLIEKIIRKKLENPNREITLENYRTEVTDLIGIRALHIFKLDIYNIHYFILDTFNLKEDEQPTHYYREGDESEFVSMCKGIGCEQKKHKKGYRSVHYIVSTSLTKDSYFAEIQVRTIFEEGWSEIDHKIRYSFKNYSETPFDSSLKQLNTLAGLADEHGATIKKLEEKEQEKILEPKKVKRKK